MEIPISQEIRDKFFVRPDYLTWIKDQTAIIAYVDLTNVLHWQDTLGWRFRIEDLMHQLLSYPNIKDVRVYYGSNPRDPIKSKVFHGRIKKAGAILTTKPMKFIPKTIEEGMFFQRGTLSLFDQSVKAKIGELIDEIHKQDILIEEPKCNFDVEMAMDLLDDAERVSAVMLFSGDSDMVGPLERLKIKGKKIAVVGVRGKVAGELHQIKDKYFDFGKLYTGKRNHF